MSVVPVLVSAACSSAQPSAPPWRLVWADDFNRPAKTVASGIVLNLVGATLIDFNLQDGVNDRRQLHWGDLQRRPGFDRATFSSPARFDGATFNGNARFDEVTFTGAAVFNGVIFRRGERSLSFGRSQVVSGGPRTSGRRDGASGADGSGGYTVFAQTTGWMPDRKT